jgi:hypothetical protein
VTIAGSSCGVRPTAIAEREEQRLERRLSQRRVPDEYEDGQGGGDLGEQRGERREPPLERRRRLSLAEAAGDAAQARCHPGQRDDARASAAPHDGA